MADTPTTERSVPVHKPPAWANTLMKWACTTPGIQRMVGQGVALISFTGRRTGKRYTIPVSYHREDETVTVITKRERKWWHNFESPTEVELRLAGRRYRGEAVIEAGDDETVDFMVAYLEKRPIDAKAYGLPPGEVDRDEVARVIPHLVFIRMAITPIE